MARFDITGIDLASLRGMIGLDDSTLVAAMLRAGQILERYARINVANRGGVSNARDKYGRPVPNASPDWLRVQTDRLRSSITHALSQPGAGVYEAHVGSNVEYARIHEYGAKAGEWRAWGRETSTPFPKRAYLRPAWDEHGSEAVAAVRAALGGRS